MKKVQYLLLILLLWSSGGCNPEAKVDTQQKNIFQVTKNESSYESFWKVGNENKFIMNLAINHSADMNIQKEDFKSIELLPATNIVKVEGFNMEKNTPLPDLQQKGFFIYAITQATGKHTFHKIVFHSKDGNKKELDIGNLTINVHDGIYSGIQPLTKGAGVFSKTRPLILNASNENDYPVKVTGVLINNPNIKFTDSDIKVTLNGKEQLFSKGGYILKPKEQLPIQINWEVVPPPNQILNIDVRPLIVSEYKGKVEYADIPNMVFRNDFSEDKP
ncbi:hypothetical protein [Baia soyae]|uniref:Lipoprotein n=1 Tax=Baia soyae TaxID=1544746 RepID=A0A4R2SC34_9BACL|nr:hypothetical protein [Baia soyae]TCP70376.1 hypothetical protein EDD57_10215 [Baia soyae]